MRIAFTNWSNRMVGGAEFYVDDMAHYLLARGHQVSFWHQTSLPEDRCLIPIVGQIPTWNASISGTDATLAELRRWQPDIVYCQGMLDPETETAAHSIAPSVFFAHNYHGTCISGSRCTTFPVARPCNRRFGPACLLHYLPRRCGGLNPAKMLQSYRLAARRLRVLRRYSQVLTHNESVNREYRSHGVRCKRIRYYTPLLNNGIGKEVEWKPNPALRLLMIGRMMPTKGGHLLLSCLPEVSERLRRPVSLTIAGDGPSRFEWAAQAAALTRNFPAIEVNFPGWVEGDARERVFDDADLLVLPSVWPEPFGLVGLEAASRGIPAAAFGLGGIPNWLSDGESGFLAPADPPTARGLAEVIVRCTADELVYRRLRKGALNVARELDIERHYQCLMSVFHQVVERSEPRRNTGGAVATPPLTATSEVL